MSSFVRWRTHSEAGGRHGPSAARALAVVLLAAGQPHALSGTGRVHGSPSAAAPPAAGPRGAPDLGPANAWMNSPPLTAAGLRGKVVLVQFWTYTCINWLRTLPYVRAWNAKYQDHGLVVVGVHSPEFAFAKDVENVRRAVKAMRIDYPVAIDSDHAVWRAFDNEAWPALYFIDAQGQVRRRQLGEGERTTSSRWTRAAHRFHARDVHLVMGPAARGTSVRFRVLVDGQPPGAAHGSDVDEEGRGTVGEQRLYQLIRQLPPILDRQLEIEFLDAGVEAFAFTFG